MSQNISIQRSSISWRPIAASPWALAILVAITYFAAARLGLALQKHGVAMFWPAAGISAGTLIALGPRVRWPVAAGVIVANLAANLLGDRNVGGAVVFSLADAGEALLAAALIEYRFGERFELDRLSHVLGLLVAAAAATAVSGVIGTVGYVLFHPSTASTLLIWHEWWASDALGIVAVAPLLIGFAGSLRRRPTHGELVEGIIALTLLTAVSTVVVYDASGPWTMAVPLALSFPLLLWIGARCPPIFAAAASFIASTTINLTTTYGIGIFGDPALAEDERIHAARAGILAVAFCALVLSALFAERRRQEVALRESAALTRVSEERLRTAIEAGHMAIWERDEANGVHVWSDELYRMFGFSVGEVPPNRAAWLARVHPEDRASAEAVVVQAKRDLKDCINEFRIVTPDHTMRWIRTHIRFVRGDGNRLRKIGLVEDITEAKQHIEMQRVLVAELQHRTRNLMAVVESIAQQTLDATSSRVEFEERFGRRLQTLSRVQSLLSRADSDPITIGTLTRMELEAIGADVFGDRIETLGPEVPLRKSAVEMLSLAIHELATNAVKYGALANTSGRLSVIWSSEGLPPEHRLVIDWVEYDIEAASNGNNEWRGYGRTLIEEALPYSIGAETRFELEADRLHCCISLPLRSDGIGEAAA
jgi:PAS domain S-box-containing protein